MTKRIGAAILAAALMFGGSVALRSAAAAPLQTAVLQTGEASDIGARRHVRHHRRYVDRQVDRPYYYDRPSYYAPAPFFPFLGLGYGPWW
jgi:DNA-binding IclR family transcriptional regulator